MSKLQDFREQYPQYGDMTDEDLADALHRRFYQDMPAADYRKAMGLPALEVQAEPPKPTVWDRVKSIWSDEQKKPQRILSEDPAGELGAFDQDLAYELEAVAPVSPGEPPEEETGSELQAWDQLFAGFDEYRANRQTSEAFDAIDTFRNAEGIVLGDVDPGTMRETYSGTASQIDRKIRKQYLERGDEEQRAQVQSKIDQEIAELREASVQRLQAAIDQGKEYRERAAQVPYSQETRAMLEADTFGAGLDALAEDPILVIAETSLRSLPNMAEALPLAVGGAIAGGPWGFAAGMGAGSGMVEYRNAFSEYLQEQGVDINDARSLLTASQDDDLMRQAHDYAGTRATIIGGASMLGGKISTQTLTPFVKNAVGRELANVGAQTVVQTSLEAGGEAGAQLATKGELDPGEVLAEATGSLVDAPIEVGAAAVTGIRADTQQQRAQLIEEEVKRILGRDLPDDDAEASTPAPATPEPDRQIFGARGSLQDLASTEERDDYKVRFKQTEETQVNIGLEQINSPSDAAHVFSWIRKRGQEAFFMLVTDAEGKPINLIRHTEGVKDMAPADPAAMIAGLGNTPGAANVWFSHNHPSGQPNPSPADRKITDKLVKMLDGTGIKFQGHIIVGPKDGTATFLERGGSSARIDITPAVRDKRLVVTTKNMRRKSPEQQPQMSSAANVIKYLGDLETRNGILFLDNQLRVAAIKAMGPDEMRTLRDENRVNRILATIDASNASNAIVFGEDVEGARNVSKMLNNIGFSVHDFIYREGDDLRSTANAGMNAHKSTGTFSSRVPRGTVREQLADKKQRKQRERAGRLEQADQAGEFELGGYTFKKGPQARNDEVVIVPAADLERLWPEGNKVGPGPDYRNQIGNRIQNFNEWLDRQGTDFLDKAGRPKFTYPKEAIILPDVYYNPQGYLDFGNGRHRVRALMERGLEQIPLALDPESAARLRAELGQAQEGQVLDARQPTDRRQAGGDQEPTGRERRRQARRDRIQRMSLDQLVDAQYTDPLTGLGNRQAFEEEAGDHAFIASIDADSLKWINDNLGHDAGDALLKAVAEAINQPEVDAYRIGGDEFYIGGSSREQVVAAVQLAQGILANQAVTSPQGSKKGLEITAGIGTDKASADSRMEIEKKRKKGRAERGAAPQGVTLNQKAKPIDMNPGTNYVPIIGRHGDLPIDPNHNLILQTTGKPLRIPKTPVRREHILAVMQKYFGKRIYQGRVKGKLRLGFYRPGHGETRIKAHNDIEVAAHEIAHYLDDRYPWIARLYEQYSDEVRSVSYDEKLIYEGWAEFMRLFMTQESEAIKRTPSFYDAFKKTAAETDPRLWNMLVDLQELMHAWTMQGARARGASKHANQGPSFFEQIRRLFPTNLFQSALDGLRSIKTIAADLADVEQPGVQLAYEKLRLAIGGSNGVLEAAAFYGTPGWRRDGQGIELNGESLMSIFGKAWGDNDVAMYMIARRAEELAGQGRENLMRPDEIAAWLQLEETRPELRDMFDRYQAFNDRILDFAEGGGILNPETRAAFQEMNKSYVPFNRVIESITEGRKIKSGGNPFMRLSGGTQNINNIWDNIITNVGQIIRMSMVNDGKRQVLSHLAGTDRLGAGRRNANAGKYAAPIGKDVKPIDINREQILRKAVEAMGITWKEYRLAKETGMVPPGDRGDYVMAIAGMIDRMSLGLEEFVTFWKFNQDPTGANVDYYMTNGEKVFFEINDPNLMDTLKFLGPRGTNLVTGILGGFSATLRRGVVAVPVFQVKNFMRDTINAWLLSSHVKVPAVRAMRVVMSRMHKDPAYQEMLINGGGFANRSQGLEAQRRAVINPMRLAAVYDRFMGRFENANRLAEYKAARAAGESPRRAALLSRDISTDFAMRGSSDVARFLAISVPFLNARVQGLYRVKRQFDSWETTLSYATKGLALAGATMALYALNKDDDRYKELPEDYKDLYWIFFTGDGEDDYVMFPKPFESGMLFGTLPERMYEFAEQENGKEFADALGWMMLQTFNMDMTPQAFQPLIDLQRNKNFTGAPIIPFYLENVEPTEQYTYYTSETVREAAQAMGVSPIKMEYMLRGYLGTLGTYAIAAGDSMIRATVDAETRQFGEDATRGETWKENILVKALVDPLVNEGPPRRTKYVTDLYDLIREADKVANTVALHERRTLDQLEAYLDDPEKMTQYATHEALTTARSQLNEIRKMIDNIRQSRELTGDEKRVQIWELTRHRNRVAREAVLAIQEAQERTEQQLQQQRAAAGAQ